MKNILLILLVLAVSFLIYKQTHQRLPQSPVATNSTSQQTSETPVKDSKTYSNATYGFSFEYPKNWTLTENAVKKEVTIATPNIVGVNPENIANTGYPAWSITFTATDKAFFTPPVGTKYGMVSYDEQQKTLVTETCLKASKLLGAFDGNTSTIKAITYGGSMMSDPAYSNAAILTTNGRIIIVTSKQGVPQTPELLKELALVANSFALTGNNSVSVATCAQ